MINGWELQIALEAMGQNPQEDDIKTIIVQLGAEKNGTLGQHDSLLLTNGDGHRERMAL